MARAMLNEAKLEDKFWKEAIQTIVYIQNIKLIRCNSCRMPYELCFCWPVSGKNFKIFGSK